MRRLFILITFVLLLIAGFALGVNPNTAVDAAAGLQLQQAQPIDQIEQTAVVERRLEAQAVTAEAYVKPIKHAALGMQAAGIVEALWVAEGDFVTAGQTLLRLENAQLRANLAQAQAALRKAEAALTDLKAGARAEEIAAAEALVDAQKARLTQLTEAPRAEDAAAAQAALRAAQALVADLLDGPDEEFLIIARRERDNAKAALQIAQSAYNDVKWAADIEQRPESMALWQATNTFEAAEANFQEVAKGADDAEIAQAYAQLEAAKSQVAHVQVPARDSEIALMLTQIINAQSQLDLLVAGPRAETIAVAEADVEIATAAVAQIEAALADTELKAPFAGVVASLEVEVGETIAAGMVVMQLGDTSAWEIETDDLIDLDVVKIGNGSKASILIDALPDLVLTGTVRRIKPLGETKFGDMTYSVFIQPDRHEERLQWNMTAEVAITPQD